jgi:alpha-beta hydrolase superfamily lysophospholipase
MRGVPVLSLAVLLGLPPVGAFAPQRVTFRTDDGVTLAGTWYEASLRPAPAVVLVHMFHRSRRDWDQFAAHLASGGIGVLAFDLRGHGESQGAIGQDLAAMVVDVRAARRFAAGRADVQPGKIGIGGASLGANLAALEAADDPGVASVALLSPSLDYRGLRIEAAVRKYGNRPVLFVASDDDPYASRSVRDLQKASGRGHETLVLNQAGHGTTMLVQSPGLADSLVDWFRRTLL